MTSRHDLETLKDLLGVADTLLRNSDGALIAKRPSLNSAHQQLMRDLPKFAFARDQEFLLKNTLGEGGMGLVRIAQQNTIGREVAIKTLRPDRIEPQYRLQLLREAWLTGSLEHPNIIPIYAVGADQEGTPVIVMKRVEGTPWSEILYTENRTMSWHLSVLLQVCRAVEFASSKGIIHRDLKPDNVMIGAFGEVYVLDWGIAVTTGDDRDGRLPRASEVRGVSGTPGYMAPEMLQESGDSLCAQTDVYLLGATLHELLLKEKRHTGENLHSILISSLESEPFEYGDRAPQPLAEICNRATALAPEDRFSSAAHLRSALELYLQHEDSRRLTERAWECLRAWRALENPEPVQAQDYFSRCRFGFGEALRTWPENEAAQAGLQESFERMFEFELHRDQLDAAAWLLKELSGRPDLQERLSSLEARLSERRAEFESLRSLQANRDLTVGRRTRAFVMFLTALTWGGLPLCLGYAQRSGFPITYQTFYLISLLKLINGVIVAWWARDSLSKTAVNRQLTAVSFLLIFIEAAVRPFAENLGHPIEHALFVDFGIYALAIAELAITVDRRLFYAPLVYLVAALMAYCSPNRVMDVLGFSHLIAFLTAAAIWRPKRLKGPDV